MAAPPAADVSVQALAQPTHDSRPAAQTDAASTVAAATPSAAPTPSATPLDGGFADPQDAARAQMPADVPVFETEDELIQTTILISAVGDCTLGGDVGSSSGERFFPLRGRVWP